MNSNKWLMGGAIILLLLVLLFYRIPIFQFQTYDETYYLLSESFTLSWIHSVEREEWHEVYTIDDQHLLLTETYFKTFGAGTPYNGKIVEDEEYVRIKVNRRIPELNIIVSHNVKTTVETNHKSIQLYNFVKPYEEITVTIKEIHVWDLLGRRFL